MNTRVGLTISAIAVALLCGCSQAQGLAAQGNMNVIYLATATNDVLAAHHVEVLQAPRCSVDSATNYSCTGTTMSGAPIVTSVPDADSNSNPVMTITVGGVTIYHGPVLTVINENSEATP